MRGGGPKTAAGKAVVRLNAMRHGLRTVSPVVPGLESEQDWRRHLEGIEASLAPVGNLEAALTERVALVLWRLRRLALFETVTMRGEVEKVEADWAKIVRYSLERAAPEDRGKYISEPERVAFVREQSARRVVPGGDVLERVLRYEAHLHRQLLQTLHELEALQARRRGEVTPVGAVGCFDVAQHRRVGGAGG